MKDTITITKELFLQLRVNSEILNRFYAGGIDGWYWYEELQNPEGKPDMDEFKKTEKARIAAL